MRWFVLHPRVIALLVLLAALVAIAASGAGRGPASYAELEALRDQGTEAAVPVQKPEALPPLRTVEDSIRASGLVAYDVAAAAQMLEHDGRGDLFDCYVSMFLPRCVQPGNLDAIRNAIRLLEDVPLQARDYRYHIKMTYCQFYRFVLIPVVHQRVSGETDLPAEQLQEAGASFDAALEHAGEGRDALSGVLVQLRAMSVLLEEKQGKCDPSRLNSYYATKRPLIRQLF